MRKNNSTPFYTYPFYILIAAFFLSGCKVYKQNIILQAEEDLNVEQFQNEIAKVEEAYEIKAGDKLMIEVYTNKGERVLDPNLEIGSTTGARTQMQYKPSKEFDVLPTGEINLPLLGKVKVTGYSINLLQQTLQEQYSEIYIEPYVRVSPLNRRVIVLGAIGGHVIPLANEKMNLLEVLALSGGLTKDSKGGNIRLIRGPLDNPAVQIIDLSTIEGMQKANLDIIPGDIVYVEPQRRIFNESVRDFAPILGIIANIATLVLVIQNIQSSNDDPQ